MHVFVICKTEEGTIKDEGADFTHYKSMRSGRIFKSSETLWLPSLPAKVKKIRSKIEALECSQHYTSIFQTHKGIYSEVVGVI